MKLSLVISFALLAVVSAFAPLPQSKISTTALSMGWLDQLFDKPLHGHGSGEDELDEQWRLQQEILQERRAHGIDKAHLKEKYSHEENRRTLNLGGRSQDFNSGEMYVDEGKKKAPAGGKKMKFPWER